MNSIDFAQLQLWLSAKFLDVTNKECPSDYWNGYSRAPVETMKYARQELRMSTLIVDADMVMFRSQPRQHLRFVWMIVQRRGCMPLTWAEHRMNTNG